jgi:hypothetical protein
MILEYSETEFLKEYVFGNRRKELYRILKTQIEIIDYYCFGYQTLIIGSFIKKGNKFPFYKEKPCDIDMIFRGFVTEEISNSLPKNNRTQKPYLPFTDYDTFVDIIPIEPIICETPRTIELEALLDSFNETNGYNESGAICILEFQKTS